MKLKNIFAAVFLTFACAAQGFAAQNLEETETSNCLKYDGSLVMLQTPPPRPRAITFCHFGINAGMDARTLYVSRYSTAGPYANQAYHQTPLPTAQACLQRGGQTVRAFAGAQPYDICIFWDDSAIDNRTLENGMGSSWNHDLNTALGF